MAGTRGRQARWGSIRELRSGRYQASYPDPTAPGTRRRITAPTTYDRKTDADQWLATERTLIAQGTWTHPDERDAQAARDAETAARGKIPFGEYAKQWISTRTGRDGTTLKTRTKEEYERYLDDRLQCFHDVLLDEITPQMIRAWYAEQTATGRLTAVARQYDLLKSILKTATEDDLIPKNPANVRGGSKATTGVDVMPPTADELITIIDHMPQEWKAAVALAAGGGLRYGEIGALTRADVEIDEDHVVVHVSRGLVRTQSGTEITTPKTKHSMRSVVIYGTDAAIIAAHVQQATGEDQPLFTGTYAALQYHWRKARDVAGRPDLHFHALRHYAGTTYAQAGATLAEIMARLGHTNVSTAMRYQHAGTREDELARRAARGCRSS